MIIFSYLLFSFYNCILCISFMLFSMEGNTNFWLIDWLIDCSPLEHSLLNDIRFLILFSAAKSYLNELLTRKIFSNSFLNLQSKISVKNPHCSPLTCGHHCRPILCIAFNFRNLKAKNGTCWCDLITYYIIGSSAATQTSEIGSSYWDVL